jgi:hypothetical protein
MERVQATASKVGKRKAENQDNERLSKRLSLLNLGNIPSFILVRELTGFPERNGQKLYVPVETPSTAASSSFTAPPPTRESTSTSTSTRRKALRAAKPAPSDGDDMMQLDSSKHKVYIYDLDAELSDSESSDDGRLVFLPDIEKHLRETRIPPVVLANSEGELAGNDLKQLVLYHVPSSLSVPEERDSVRKAIIEARARARERQQERLGEEKSLGEGVGGLVGGSAGGYGGSWSSVPVSQEAMDLMNCSKPSNPAAAQEVDEYDPDAMDLG